jgi:ComF family protein
MIDATRRLFRQPRIVMPRPNLNPLRRLVGRSASTTLDWLCPPACVLCDTPGAMLCDACRTDATAGVDPACPRCAIPLPRAASLCGRCLKRSPAFDRTWAAALYTAPFTQLVRGLKYGATLAYAPLLADLLLARATAADEDFDRILPVPLSRERMGERGFNQSIEIARVLAQRLDLPLDTRSVLRILDTSPQASLALAARRRNLRGAFSVVDGSRQDLVGSHVAIVDDVMTTGATLDELARTLKRAGVARVTNLVVARTP